MEALPHATLNQTGYINIYAPIRGRFNFPKCVKDVLVEKESVLDVGVKIDNT